MAAGFAGWRLAASAMALAAAFTVGWSLHDSPLTQSARMVSHGFSSVPVEFRDWRTVPAPRSMPSTSRGHSRVTPAPTRTIRLDWVAPKAGGGTRTVGETKIVTRLLLAAVFMAATLTALVAAAQSYGDGPPDHQRGAMLPFEAVLRPDQKHQLYTIVKADKVKLQSLHQQLHAAREALIRKLLSPDQSVDVSKETANLKAAQAAMIDERVAIAVAARKLLSPRQRQGRRHLPYADGGTPSPGNPAHATDGEFEGQFRAWPGVARRLQPAFRKAQRQAAEPGPDHPACLGI